MGLYAKLVGALIITYFVSRVTLRLPIPLKKANGIAVAHLLSLALIAISLFVVKGSAESLALYLSPQVLWGLLDLLREHEVGKASILKQSGEQAP
jgi:hypothetical protein